MGRPRKWDYSLKREGETNRAFRHRMFREKVPALIQAPAYRTSRQFTPDGALKGYSTFQTQSDVDRASNWDAVRQGFLDSVPVCQEVPLLSSPYNHNKTRLFIPIGDQHLGMLAWRPEVGASYDLDIGEKLLTSASSSLMHRAAYCDSACLVGLGDFMHYDGTMPITQRGGNILDNEGRYRKMIRVALRCWRTMIFQALNLFEVVHVIVASGNHDEFSMAFVSEALALHYGDNPRVVVDTTPGRFHYHLYGANLVGVTHGDKAKPPQLPGIMAQDRPNDWAATTHRTWWTGHVHSHADIPYTGCNVETFGILAPGDAWSHSMGYRSRREIKAIVLSESGGEYARYTVKPEDL